LVIKIDASEIGPTPLFRLRFLEVEIRSHWHIFEHFFTAIDSVAPKELAAFVESMGRERQYHLQQPL